MNNNTVNLANTLKIFKKNLKKFYFFISIGILFGLIGILLNNNYIEKKTIISSTISIKNPLANYELLELLSLNSINIDEEKVSMASVQEKIQIYNLITKEYMAVILNEVDLKKYDIDEEKYGYEIIQEKNQDSYRLKIINVANAGEVKKNLKKISNNLNKMIKPIIFGNLIFETKNAEYFMEMYGSNPTSKKLSILIQIRKEIMNSYENRQLEIFETSLSQTDYKISNKRIFSVSILISFSLFLLLIILKK